MMQHLKILNSKETKRILKLLQQQFGFEEKLDFVFLVNNKDRVYVVNRDIEKVELEKLRINALGLYFGTFINGELRLSIEGSQLIGSKAKKNILDIDDKEFEMWLKGEDFEVSNKLKGFVIVKHKNDFVGCGKIKDGTLLNYVPKARRLIVVNN